jgi:hypothetical protein
MAVWEYQRGLADRRALMISRRAPGRAAQPANDLQETIVF